jgi:hypothetical protein
MKSILKLITGVALIATPTASIIACSSNPPIQPIIEDLTPDMLPIKPHMLPINNVVPNLSNILINRNLGHVYCKVDNGDVFDQQMLAFLKEREPEVLNGIK